VFNPLKLHVVALNLKRGGYDRDTRQHDHGKLFAMLSALDSPPHILFLSECTYYTEPMVQSAPLFDVKETIASLWGYHEDEAGNTFPKTNYEAFISEVHGSVNVPGLFVDPRYVRPLRWYDETQRRSLANSLTARINGHDVQLKSVHWNGSGGATMFDQQASQDGQMAQHAAVIGGDFNATSSHPKESIPANWGDRCDSQGQAQKRSQKGARGPGGVWTVYTEAIDSFQEHGWWDAGEKADDFTVTVNPWVDGGSGMRIDRIMVSDRTPAQLVPGSYKVHVPKPGEKELSDHRMVSCWLEFAPAGGTQS
jgi:hypothetical protein